MTATPTRPHSPCAALTVPPAPRWQALLHRQPTRQQQLDDAANHIRRPRRTEVIAVLGGKGGVGKTTTAIMVGSMLSAALREPAVVVDTNPDISTLRVRMPHRAVASLQQLAADCRNRSRVDLAPYLLHNPCGLHAVSADPSRHMPDDGYSTVLTALAGEYRLLIADCGTSLDCAATRTVLQAATQLVVVTSAAIDSYHGVTTTFDQLDAAGHGRLVAKSCTVMTTDSRSTNVDIDKIHAALVKRSRRVQRIPRSRGLDDGGVIDPAVVDADTKIAYAQAAAAISTRF